MGDKTKIITLLLLGITVSLIKSLAPSAPACNNPNVPTIFGPLLAVLKLLIYALKL